MSSGSKGDAAKLIAWGAGVFLGGLGAYKLVDSIRSARQARELEEGLRRAALENARAARQRMEELEAELEEYSELAGDLEPDEEDLEPEPAPRLRRTARPSAPASAPADGGGENDWMFKLFRDVKEKKDALDAQARRGRR